MTQSYPQLVPINGINFPKDIADKAAEIAQTIGNIQETVVFAIASALLEERQASAAELEHWQNKWRAASFQSDASYAVSEYTRKFTKEIFGTNATFVDDDLKLLAYCADLAVASGIQLALPTSVTESIEKLKAARRTPKGE